MRTKWVSRFMILFVLLGMFFIDGCKKNSEVNDSSAGELDINVRLKVFGVINYCVPTIANLIYQIFTRMYDQKKKGIPIELGEYENGWWVFEKLSLIYGQKADGRAQLLDDNGIPHKDYEENTTAKFVLEVEVRAEDPISTDLIDIKELELSQLNKPESDMLAIGYGSFVYRGQNGDFQSNDLTFQKDVSKEFFDRYDSLPTGGTMTFDIGEINVIVEWGEEGTVFVTVIYQGESYYCTINLENPTGGMDC